MKPAATWASRVNSIMKRDYAITLEDVGADADTIERYRRGEPDPQEFVRWFARKYDLTSAAEVGLGPIRRA